MEKILTTYKAILFDMDGVLVNSLDYWKKTEEKMLEKFGVPRDLNAFQATESMSTKGTIAFWLQKYPQEKRSLENIEQFVIAEMTACIELNECINQEILQLILKWKHANYKLGLATNSPKEVMRAVLKKANLESIFHALVSADDVVKVKPDPEIYLKTAHLLDVLPKDCLVIEDSDYGIQAAIQAGMDVIPFREHRFQPIKYAKK